MPNNAKINKSKQAPINTGQLNTVELRRLIAKKVKHIGLLSLNNLYNPARSADQLNQMLESLAEHLRLPAKISFSAIFSDQTQFPGNYEVKSNKVTFSVNSKLIGNPYKCAAFLARGLTSYWLKHLQGVEFTDKYQNEKAIDLSTIYAGFSILIINSLRNPGYLDIYSKLTKLGKTKGIISLPDKVYGEYASDYLLEQHSNKTLVNDYLAPWSLSLVDNSLLAERPPTTSYKQKLLSEHSRQLHSNMAWLSIAAISIAFLTAIIFSNPPILNNELRVQENKVNQLRLSYEGCANRVELISQIYPINDPSIWRFLESQKTVCASLKNRYNHEVEIYRHIKSGS